MLKSTKLVICAFALVIGGCASTGPIPIGKDTYMISKQSAGGMFVSASSVKGEIFQEGFAFCQKQNKVFQIVRSNELSAIPGLRLPSAEVQFMCLSENDPELTRPKLKKEADTVVEVHNK
jgi:hypothetical protein